MDWMPQAIREGILTVIFISGPLVVLAASIGLTIGVIQAATQVQEQTLGSAAKILGIFLALIVFGFYIFQYLKNYAEQNINRAFKLVPTLESHPLPPKKLFSNPIEKANTQDAKPQVKVTKAPKPPAPSAAPALSSTLNEPDTTHINHGHQSQTMPAHKPKPQDHSIREQSLSVEPVQHEEAAHVPPPVVQTKPVVTKPAPVRTTAPATEAVIKKPAAPVSVEVAAEPVVKPAASVSVEAAAEAVEKKPSRARSGIDRLRNSIKEFKQAQEAR